MTQLQEANAISDQFFASCVDPDLLADRRRAERETSIAADIARWRACLEAHLDETLAGSDAEMERRLSWLFPTGGRSSTDPTAPVIGRRELRALAQRTRR